MKPEKFVSEVIKLYQEARIPKYPHKKISRGGSHTIASYTEDLMAFYLISNDNLIDKIYVNQQIHVPGIVKSFKPDIVIVRDSQISAFLDLKTNLGYMRDGLVELCKKDNSLVKTIRNRKCTLTEGITKEKISLTISSKAIYDIVIISGKNINNIQLQAQLDGARQYRKSVSVHVLTNGISPGSYGLGPKEILSSIEIDNNAFMTMNARLNS